MSFDLNTSEFGPHLRYTDHFSFTADGAFDPITGHFFAFHGTQLFEFDPDTRDVLNITDLDELIRYPSQVPGAREPQGMVFSGDGKKLYITTEEGSGDRPGRGELVVLDRTIVPEPSSLALLTIGLGLAAFKLSRFRAR